MNKLGPIAAAMLVGGVLLSPVTAQVDEDQLGAWYMYFWNTTLGESRWGFQGDAQYRAWDLLPDMEQLLIRGGATYTPRSANVTFTLGYANITSGEFGDGDATTAEHRMYQEVLLPQKVGSRVYLRHRFRFEQRWVEDQDFRTRYRYNLFMDIPVNRADLSPGAVYVELYNELFINGQTDIGDGREVERFDRNRFYGAIGYVLADGMKLQGGFMAQTTETFTKHQLQLSFHHTF